MPAFNVQRHLIAYAAQTAAQHARQQARVVVADHYHSQARTGRRCPTTVSWRIRQTSSAAAVLPDLALRMSPSSTKTACPSLRVHLALDCSTSPIVAPSAFPALLSLIPRLVVVTRLSAGALLARDCSGSCRLSDSAAACPGSAALGSTSCPSPAVHAAGAPLHRDRPPLGAAREALVAAVAAAAHPTDHSVLRRDRPPAASGPAAGQTRMRTARAMAALPLDRVGAIAEMAGPFPCSMRADFARCASRLPCPRPLRCRGAAAGGCCTVT
jgi:hypothetical protein